eukprot:4803134-Pyramimonas_sp.AAC.2
MGSGTQGRVLIANLAGVDGSMPGPAVGQLCHLHFPCFSPARSLPLRRIASRSDNGGPTPRQTCAMYL